MTASKFDYSKMTEEQFQQATKEFIDNGGVIQQLAYRDPKNTTFESKGVIASTGFSRAQVNGFASVDALVK